jgi:hypothetical protein
MPINASPTPIPTIAGRSFWRDLMAFSMMITLVLYDLADGLLSGNRKPPVFYCVTNVMSISCIYRRTNGR